MPPSAPESSGRVVGRLRRHRVVLLSVLAAVVAVRAVLPWGLARVVESLGQSHLGRTVRIENVDLGLFPGRIRVEGLWVGKVLSPGAEAPAEPDPERALLRLGALEANVEWLGLLSGQGHVSEVRVVEPQVRVVVSAEGRLVPIVAVPPQDPAPEPEPGAAPEEEGRAGLPLVLDVLAIDGASFLLVNLARPDKRPLELRFAQLSLRDVALREGEISVGDVGLRGPYLRLRRDIDVSAFQGEPFQGDQKDAAAQVAEARADSAEAAEAEPLPLRVANVGVEGAELVLLVDGEEVVTSLDFLATGVNLVEPFPLRFELALEDGSLEVEGQASASPVSFEGRVAWRDLPLGRLAQAAGALPLDVNAGAGDGELEVMARLGPGPGGEPARIAVSGRIASRAVAAALPPANGTAVDFGWEELEIALESVDVDPSGETPAQVAIQSVALAAPRVKAMRSAPPAEEAAAPAAVAEAPTEAAEASAEGPSPEEPAPAAAPPQVKLASLSVSDGEIEFSDETVTPRHRTVARPFNLDARGLAWPELQVAALKLDAARENAKLGLDLSVDGGDANAKLAVESLRLTPWSPYLAESAGYWIEEGTLDLDASLDKQGQRMKIDGTVDTVHLRVDEVKPGSFEEQFGLTLDLALALLRDPLGRISFPIPVELNGDETGVSLAPLVAAVLRQAILGAVTAPLKGIGLVLGGDRKQGMGLEPVAIAPGKLEPAASELDAVTNAARVLKERPGLAVVLHGRAGPADDPALAERILIEAVVQDRELPPVSAGFFQRRRLEGALEKRGEGRRDDLGAEDRALLESWIDSVEVPAERREAFANERARALRERVLAQDGLSLDRVTVGSPFEGDPGVLVQLKVEGSAAAP